MVGGAAGREMVVGETVTEQRITGIDDMLVHSLDLSNLVFHLFWLH